MKLAINAAAVALLLLASAPAFAHGGMGHMGGNMGKTSQPTVIRTHFRGHHMRWRYSKTTKITGRTHIVRLKTFSPRQILRLKMELGQIRLELIKLGSEGLANSPLALRLGKRGMAISQLINGTPNFN